MVFWCFVSPFRCLVMSNQVTEKSMLSYHMSEVKTSVVSKPLAFLEELPLSEKH